MTTQLRQAMIELEEAVSAVEARFGETRAALEKKSAAHEHVLQQYWSHGKRIALLESQSEEYDVLVNENKLLLETQQVLRQRLSALLETTRDLGEALRG